nr:hypothetical protein BaRGS_033390 [Batillaria attramentaria]
MDATTVVCTGFCSSLSATAVVRSDDGEEPECRPGLLTTAPTRNSDRLPCSKIYIDPYKSSDKVLEVSFLCACPEGQMCPGRLHKKTEDGDLETESDEQGTFVYKYCENTKLSRQTA